ncbi:alpha,alpha-trehalose phosphorylase [Nocardioides lianchengensis]|uniref:Alpha,alpha-trehalose phosphorylase n=2 Tax=Nocardioides lianchengensis TaxID=1045774 RepID=A0A1G6NQZ3_9ACTN|nr:alpha,alpha-trehalose phosphorylase [Nocardioides lianchengensis]SDC70400.1 alpha,alpha-trehalose phosphorylase [Nocardioides lianchengensis]
MNPRKVGPDPMDRGRFPIDPWRLVETSYHPDDLGVTETLFTVANGYLGMRGNPEEGRPSYAHGTFVNGFHETWPIRHAEAAFGFARTGQTIVNVPDAKVVKIYVDDEPLTFGTSDLEFYERSLDFRDGLLRRNLVWRTPSGKRVRIHSTRMVSMTQRHLSFLTLEITMLSGDAPVVVSSQIINRQDGRDEYVGAEQPQVAIGMTDPRKAAAFAGRVLEPRLHYARDDRMLLGYRCATSGMTIAVAADHDLTTSDEHEIVVRGDEDLAKTVFRVDATEGNTITLCKTVAYHSSRGVPVRELSDRCDRTLDRAKRQGLKHYLEDQRAWYGRFWDAADVEVGQLADDPVGTASHELAAVQQAVRFNLFSLAQASGRTDGLGVPAKGVTGSGYEGHYFWDTEVYVIPFLTYTLPEVARNALHFRSLMLPAARNRAREMAQSGAMFPWRTINGEEASAYYAAGSAQVHIDADVAYALTKYVRATGDRGFLVREGIDILIETARMWADLGFWRSNGDESFHIHGVTGPDEYTTVVNNNLFTNVMARFNLEQAVEAVEWVREADPVEFDRLRARLDLSGEEVDEWRRCAAGMSIPFDAGLGIHPQDDFFLDREVWDLSKTPAELRPLLLHYHPLVIYRFQVLKQADVVLALFLQGDRFSDDEKRADFEYYDPITTGDSTLSACVQAIIAAEVGHHDTALRYFHEALYVDLKNLHGNTVDGMHVASCGGVWSALVSGFGGMRDHGGELSFDPRLPVGWPVLRYRLAWQGARLLVEVTERQLRISLEVPPAEGDTVTVSVRGTSYDVSAAAPLEVVLDDQGPRMTGVVDDHPITGGIRADGSTITAGVPDPIVHEPETGELPAYQEQTPPMGPHVPQS